MKKLCWMIYQGPDVWMIFGSTMEMAKWKWLNKAGYPDRTRIIGKPERIVSIL